MRRNAADVLERLADLLEDGGLERLERLLEAVEDDTGGEEEAASQINSVGAPRDSSSGIFARRPRHGSAGARRYRSARDYDDRRVARSAPRRTGSSPGRDENGRAA